MPRYLKMNIICILFLIFSVPVSSELYQYKDKNGIMRLTNDIYSVPVENRPQLEKYSEIENISDELEIQPLKIKSSPKPEKQVKTEKVISPKTSKTISKTAEAHIIPPDAPPETSPITPPVIPTNTKGKIAAKPKKEPSPPSHSTFPHLTVPGPESQVPPTREVYKSNKIIIHKNTKPLQKTTQALPAKSLKEKTGPKTPATTITSKTAPAKEKKEILKSVKPSSREKAAPETKIETKIETRIETRIVKKEAPEKIPGEKSGQKIVSKPKKDKIKVNATQPEHLSEVPKTPAPQKIVIAPQKDIKKSIKPEIKKPTPSKVPTNIATAIDKKTASTPKKTKKEIAQADTPKKPAMQTKTVKKEQSKKITAKKTVSDPETQTIESTLSKDKDLILAQLETTRKLLAGKKEALNKKFMNLMREKQALENSVNEDDKKSVLEYNENVKKLNMKIKQYKKEKKDLQAKIDEYNDTVKQVTLN